MKKSCLKHAFTLAEVLITLGIIGVVAAMTLPQLFRYYKSIVLQSQLKETYSILSQAIKLYHEETGETLGNVGKDVYGRQRQAALMKYIKYSKDCGYRKLATPCTFAGQAEKNDYMNLTGTAKGIISLFGSQTGQFITNKGALITVSANNEIAVDINGYENPPNRFGLDAFYFIIDNENKLVGVKYDYACYYNLNNKDDKGEYERYTYYGNGGGCANYALSDSTYWRAVRKFL